MCHKIDTSFFTRLSAMDHSEVCRRACAEFDTEREVYRITAFRQEYEVDPARREISPSGNIKKPVSFENGLLILFYLLGAKDIHPTGKWVNEYSLKGGAMFFRGPHAIKNREIVDRYGNDTEGFIKICSKLGGQPVDMGDAAFRFQILPRIPILVVLWYGDDEFEASAKILMDETIDQHLPLDVIYAMTVEFISMLVNSSLEGNSR